LFSTDAEKLSGLIQEWGLKRVNSVTDIINPQIDIIGKLEQVVISIKALDRQQMTGWLHFVFIRLPGTGDPLKEPSEKESNEIRSLD
jgi:hypothetical protein